MFKKVRLLLAAVASLSPNLGSSSQPEPVVASPTVFERLLSEVRAGRRSNDEIWPVFLNTSFFVAVNKVDQTPDKTPDVGFVLFPSIKDPARTTVLISENPKRLEKVSDSTIQMQGGKLIQLLNPEREITIYLSEGAFRISVDVAKWLREGIQTKKR